MTGFFGEEEIDIVVPSLDGALAVRLTLYEGTHRIPNRIAVGSYFTFRRSDEAVGRVGVIFGDRFDFVEPKAFGLPENMPREDFRMACAHARIGDYLDESGLLPETPDNVAATHIDCLGKDLQGLADRPTATDEKALQFLKAKLYWCWKVEVDLTPFSWADALRLHTSLRGLKRVAQIGEGRWWQSAGGGQSGFMLTPIGSFVHDEYERRSGSGSSAASIATLLSAPRYEGPLGHWVKADDFATGEKRDFPNAAKEAVCAVEGLARIITGDHSGTLGELVKRMKASDMVNGSMAKVVEGTWGFTSNSPGVRHGGATAPTIDEREARFVLENCEALIRFMLPLDK